MTFDDDSIRLKLNMSEKVTTYDGDIDYEKNVINKPKLDGREIVGNIEELDPNVQPIDLLELNDMFNSVFN